MNKYDKVAELPDQPPPSAARRWWLALAVALGLIGGGAALYRWAEIPGWRAEPISTAIVAVPAKVPTLEKRLQEIAAELARLGKRGPVETVRGLLTEAVASQTELIQARVTPWPEDARRLDEWQSRLADLEAREWTRLSETAEAAARALGPRDAQVLREKLTEAWRWQQKINQSAASGGVKNQTRETRLEREITRAAIEPRLAQASVAQKQAELALKSAQWAEARVGFEHMRELYRQVEIEFPQAGFVPISAVQAADAGLRAAKVGEALAGVEALWQIAQAAAAAGQVDEAERQYAATARAQQQFNTEFADSAQVSTERLAAIEGARQSLRARELVRAVHDLDKRAERHRQRRENFQSQQLLTEAATKLAGINTDYPQATGVELELRRRVAWLLGREADMVTVQDQVYDLLRALPDLRARAMLRTEVGQALFELVMKRNPSRQVSEVCPVDSVTHSEAEEFCQRLGWMLGVRVRLPTVEEFKTALGDAFVAGADAWGAENSSSHSQAAVSKTSNAAGFYNLLGNVAEWLAAGEGDKAVVAGGSFADSRGQLQRVPLNTAPKITRAPTIGFRVVVEVDLAGVGL